MDELSLAKSLKPEQVAELIHSKACLEKANQELTTQVKKLDTKVKRLESQVDWFKSQKFGKKSEVRKSLPDSKQLFLSEQFITSDKEKEVEQETVSYKRKKRSKKSKIPNQVSDIGLQFDDTVEVQEVITENPLIRGLPESEYEVIGERVVYKLAQKPSSYRVLKFIQQVVKLNDKISSNPVPESVLEGTYADVSLLANLAIDKCLYHLPIYRQEQRLKASGVKISRNSLINYVQRTAEVLEPVYHELLKSIRSESIVWMDETPVKAGKSKGRMKSGWFWSLYGKSDEVAFWFDARRSSEVVKNLLPDYQGTLQTDDHGAYSKYAKQVSTVEHALCWSHTRRKFLKAENQEKELVETALAYIRELYAIEKSIKDYSKIQMIRGDKSKIVVDRFFSFLRQAFSKKVLLPSSEFTKAVNYTLDNEKELRVFLANPEVSLDTNHLERQIRPVAVGRKNWLFCDSESGAKSLAILYSLIQSCKLQGINPYHYLVDVLQRVQVHPAKEAVQLIPRNWKLHFKKEDWLTSLVDI